MKNDYYFLSRLGFWGFILGVITFALEMFGLQIIEDAVGQNILKNGNGVLKVAFMLIGTSTLAGLIIGLVIDALLKAIFGIEGYEKIIDNIKNVVGFIKMLVGGGIGAGIGYAVANGLHWGEIGGIILGIVGFLIGAIITIINA